MLGLGMGNRMLMAGSDGCGTRLIQFQSTSRAQKFEPSKKLSGNFKIGNSTKYVLFASTWHIDIQPLSMQHKSLFNVLEWCQIFWIINVPINLSFTVKSGAYTHFWIVQVSASCLDWSFFCFWYFAIKENIMGETWFEFFCSAASLGKILIWE